MIHIVSFEQNFTLPPWTLALTALFEGYFKGLCHHYKTCWFLKSGDFYFPSLPKPSCSRTLKKPRNICICVRHVAQTAVSSLLPQQTCGMITISHTLKTHLPSGFRNSRGRREAHKTVCWKCFHPFILAQTTWVLTSALQWNHIHFSFNKEYQISLTVKYLHDYVTSLCC